MPRKAGSALVVLAQQEQGSNGGQGAQGEGGDDGAGGGGGRDRDRALGVPLDDFTRVGVVEALVIGVVQLGVVGGSHRRLLIACAKSPARSGGSQS